MRSKNHMLYEMYLSDIGGDDLFERTKKYSLSHIVTFTKIQSEIDGLSALEVINLARMSAGDALVDSIDDVSNKDFSLADTIQNLDHETSDYEVEMLRGVVDMIDEYHQNRT